MWSLSAAMSRPKRTPPPPTRFAPRWSKPPWPPIRLGCALGPPYGRPRGRACGSGRLTYNQLGNSVDEKAASGRLSRFTALRFESTDDPPPPWPPALGRQRVEPIGQGAEGLIRLVGARASPARAASRRSPSAFRVSLCSRRAVTSAELSGTGGRRARWRLNRHGRRASPSPQAAG